MFDRRNNLSQAVAEDVRACLGTAVFDTVVPRNVRLSEAPSHGLPALIYDLKCPGSEAYVRLARELIGAPAAAGGGGMSTTSPRQGSACGLRRCSAKRPSRGRGAGEAPARAAASARSRSARIRPNPDQPRIQFDEEALDELADSIAERGVLQPILLRPDGDGFEIIAGERRWRAAQRARLHTIPAIVREIDDSTDGRDRADREYPARGSQRDRGGRGLSPADRAPWPHARTRSAKLVHKSRSHVANLLRLLDLPEFVRQSLLQGDISMGHARAVATAPDPEGSDPRDHRQGPVGPPGRGARARKAKPGPGADIGRASAATRKPVDADLAALERQLGDMLGLKVKVAHKGQGGTVTLHYSSLDQLDMICQRLSGEPI